MEKIDKKARKQIIEGMKRLAGVKKDVDLATELGIIPQIISAFKERGDATFYKRIFEFCVERGVSFAIPVSDVDKVCIGTGAERVPVTEVVCDPGMPLCDPDESRYVNMVLDILRGNNEQDKNSLIMNITSFHQHCKERRVIDPECVEELKKNIGKQEAADIKKAQGCQGA